MSSAVHTGFGHGCKRINKSRLDCLEHNDRITLYTLLCGVLIVKNTIMNKEAREEFKKQYEAICSVYLRLFSNMTGCEFSGWLGGRFGEVATFSEMDYCVNWYDVRLLVDNDIPKDVFFNWYDTISNDIRVNFYHYVKAWKVSDSVGESLLPKRCKTALMQSGIFTLSEIRHNMDWNDLRKIRNISDKSIKIILDYVRNAT